jgi:hypothetical protein
MPRRDFWPIADIARITGCPPDAVTRNWPLIADALERRGVYDRDVCLGVLPTVAIETASTFEPIHEYGTPEDWAGYEGGSDFAGRGFAQLTHVGNYRAAGEALGIDLAGHPDLALDARISADILAWFWATRGVPAKDRSRWWSLVDLCHEHDWEWVRRVFQGGTGGLNRLIAMASALDAYAAPKEPTMPANDALRVADGPARLRSAPGTSATIVKELPVGTALVDLGETPVNLDGHRWRRVVLGDIGWIADELLSGADSIGPIAQPVTRYTFNPDFPTQLQRQDWTCSIRSTMMLLDSIGIDVTAAEAQDAMSPEFVNSDVGLLDASGAGIVEVLRDRWGVEAFNRSPVSFDEVASWAGHQPVAIGGRAWGHWTAVRGFDGERLVLANPGGTGPRYGQQTLDRQQFADLGWFSAVTIPVS